MSMPLQFKTREEFRNWLSTNCQTSEGVWLLFGKTKEIPTLKASEALEEALCFGWIDGLMKKIDDRSYMKYFSMRRNNSNWSEKNKALVEKLEKQGIMNDYGRMKVAEAKKNGEWGKTKQPINITDEQIAVINEVLKVNELAYQNFQGMSQSVKKTYARAYFDAKTEDGRKKRTAWMIERLEKNLKPM